MTPCDCARCERAAIYEYDAGMSREDAERKAGACVLPEVASHSERSAVRPLPSTSEIG